MKKIAVLMAGMLAVTAVLCTGCGQQTTFTSEESSVSTAAATEPTTEKPTEPPTKPTTEKPTEAPTEPTTEAYTVYDLVDELNEIFGDDWYAFVDNDENIEVLLLQHGSTALAQLASQNTGAGIDAYVQWLELRRILVGSCEDTYDLSRSYGLTCSVTYYLLNDEIYSSVPTSGDFTYILSVNHVGVIYDVVNFN